MTPGEFAGLPIKSKLNLVLTNGEELLDRIYLYYVIKLYHFSGLFIEIWYQQVTNKIDRIQILDQSDVAHIYENQIDLGDLFR